LTIVISKINVNVGYHDGIVIEIIIVDGSSASRGMGGKRRRREGNAAPTCHASAKCELVRKPHTKLLDTPADITGAPK
jgi:hypothetical protein